MAKLLEQAIQKVRKLPERYAGWRRNGCGH
jgi:hypothetical protein